MLFSGIVPYGAVLVVHCTILYRLNTDVGVYLSCASRVKVASGGFVVGIVNG